MNYSYLDTPIGTLLIAGDDDAIHCIDFPKGKHAVKPQADVDGVRARPRAGRDPPTARILRRQAHRFRFAARAARAPSFNATSGAVCRRFRTAKPSRMANSPSASEIRKHRER